MTRIAYIFIALLVLLEDQIVFSQLKNEKPCDENRLMQYLAQMQVINPESVVQLASSDDPEATCEKLATSIDKLNEFFKSCNLENKKDVYVRLTRGIDTLNEKLCNDKNFKENYASHSECYRSLNEEFKDCDGPADWYEDNDTKLLCKNFKDIINCYYTKTVAICSKDAAHLIRDLARNVMGKTLARRCARLDRDPKVDPALLENFDEDGKAGGEAAGRNLNRDESTLKEAVHEIEKPVIMDSGTVYIEFAEIVLILNFAIIVIIYFT